MSMPEDPDIIKIVSLKNVTGDMTLALDTLVRIYANCKVVDAKDALVVALHALMLETGFILHDEDNNTNAPLHCKNNGNYKIEYRCLAFPETILQMTCIPLGNFLAVHGTVTRQSESISLMLNTSHFIKDTKTFSDPKGVYRNECELSICFKDQFAYAALAEIHHGLGMDPQFGFPGLPIDLKFYILSGLPVKSLILLSSTNKEFHEISKSALLWKQFFIRDFPDAMPESAKENTRWKELYMEEYIKKKKQSKQSNPNRESVPWRPIVFPPLWNPLPPVPFIDPIDDEFHFAPGIPREVQEAFPNLYNRFLTENPIILDIYRRRRYLLPYRR